MNVGINLVKYPQFLLLEFQKCANLQFIKNNEILCYYAMHEAKRNLKCTVLVLLDVLGK